MAVDISTLTTKMNGRGVLFNDFFYNYSSSVLGLIFYNTNELFNPSGDLMPKQLQDEAQLLEDGYTLKWRDLDWRRPSFTVDGAVSAAATSLSVATGEGASFVAGDQVYVPSTNETFVVTAVSTDALTITPAVGSAGIADGANIEILNATIDNNGSVNGKGVAVEAGAEYTNYITHKSYKLEFTQEKLNTVMLKYTQMGMSEEEAVAKYIKDLDLKARQEMQRDVLRSFYAGKKVSTTIGGNTFRYAGGIEEYRDSTVVDVNAETTAKAKLNKLISAFEDVQKVGVVSKFAKVVCVVDDKARREIDGWVLDLNVQRYQKQVDALGWTVTVIKTGFGDITLMSCPELDQMTSSLTYGTGYIFCPELVSVAGATKMMIGDGTGKETKAPTHQTKAGFVYYVPEGSRLQPNSPTTINLYTNYSFIFKGASLNLFKKVKF